MCPPRRAIECHGYAERVCTGLARRVQEMREARAWSMYALARESGVSREMIAHIESQESVPSVHTLAKLAFAFGVEVEVLLAGLAREYRVAARTA